MCVCSSMTEINKFKEIFDQKTIAVVGNSKSLLSSNFGNKIDQKYKVVCRINKGVYLLSDSRYSRNVGSRIDILCVNLLRTIKISKSLSNRIKIIQTSPCSYDSPDLFFVPPREFLEPLFERFSPKKPSTGLRVLHLIKEFSEPDKVDVYGFDWKQSHPSFYGTHDDWSQTEHDFKKEQDYCMNQIFSDSRFTLYE